MSIRENSLQHEAEEEGDVELVLCVLTYTGTRSMYNAENLRSQGGYPSYDPFQQGQSKLVKLPSSKLGWWENHVDFEVAYDPQSMAESMLGQNFISEQITGPGFDPDLRAEVTDKLDIEPASTEEGYREQLREMVGVEPDGEAEQETSNRPDRLAEDYDRSSLITVAGSFDESEEFKEDHDLDSISHAKNTVLAEFLAGLDNDVVDRRLDTAEAGGDI